MCSSFVLPVSFSMLPAANGPLVSGSGPGVLLASTCKYGRRLTLHKSYDPFEVETQSCLRQVIPAAAPESTSLRKETLTEEGLLLDQDVQMLIKMRSRYNLIRVLEVARRADHPLAGARLLLLDKPGNIHSIYFKYRVLTDSYYDVFGALPPLLPEGPLALLGLGAGTAARILLYFWPSLEIHGWELDAAVINVARQYFDLSELERGSTSDQEPLLPRLPRTDHGRENGEPASSSDGRLLVHEGDALKPQARVDGGFAGIIVDLFAEGTVIPALQQYSTWHSLKKKLRPGGRVMVNCGGPCVEAEGVGKKDGRTIMLDTLAALASVFPGELHWKSVGDEEDIYMDNCIAMTGPLPNFQAWKQRTPENLADALKGWKPVASDIAVCTTA